MSPPMNIARIPFIISIVSKIDPAFRKDERRGRTKVLEITLMVEQVDPADADVVPNPHQNIDEPDDTISRNWRYS